MANVVEAPYYHAMEMWDSIFLAGSIDMGKAVDWQSEVIEALEHKDINIFNPRRKDYDPTWEQDISNPMFAEQVRWELDHIDYADLVLFVFDPNGPAPISLLELGYVAGKGKDVVVVCPKGYWRRGNVQVVCHRHGFKLFDTIKEAIAFIK